VESSDPESDRPAATSHGDRHAATVSVLLVDPHLTIRLAVLRVLEESPRIRVIGEAGTARDSIIKLRQLRPDMVVTELRLPDASIVSFCRAVQFNRPGTKLVILTASADEDEVLAGVLEGADGCVPKHSDAAALVTSLLTVADGGTVLEPPMTARLLKLVGDLGCLDEEPSVLGTLTPQEDLVLTMIGEGLTNREIADSLGVRVNTVRNYVATIYAKVDVNSRPEAVALAMQRRSRLTHAKQDR
jgi:two-component system response regulator DevR